MPKIFELKVESVETDWDFRTVMKVYHKGKLIAEHSDGGEPEDNSFGRDWNWVPGLIEKVYFLGVRDGAHHGVKELLKYVKEGD
jgi:hypothetical protein